MEFHAPAAPDHDGISATEEGACQGLPSLDDGTLVVDERSSLIPEEICLLPAPAGRTAAWRKAKAFELHSSLRGLRAASHIIDLSLGRLLRLLNGSGPGFRRWGCRNFDQYVTQELRQPSTRRFRYLVAIDEAIVTRPLVKLGDAWKRGRVSVAQAREVIRVMTPENEQEWLDRADSMSVKELQAAVQRELAGAGRPGAAGVACDEVLADTAWDRRALAATRPVDDAWQVCVETSRRMAGYDMPLADCVDDLLAECASACPEVLADVSVEELASGIKGVEAGSSGYPDAEELLRNLWRQSVTQTAEARSDLEKLRQVARAARLAVNPLEGLDLSDTASPADPDDIHRRIRWVLRVGQNIAWHECRLLRLVAGLALFKTLGFPSMESYAIRLLGYSVRTLRGRLALVRTTRQFPKIAAAFRCGRITGAEALLIGKVARPGTQGDWISRAAASTLHDLKNDVEFSLHAEDSWGLPPRRPLPEGVRPCARPLASRNWAEQPEPDPEDDCMRVRTCVPQTTQNSPTPPSRRVDGWYSAFCSDPSRVVQAMLSPSGSHRPITFHAPVEICPQWDLTLAHCRATAAGDGPLSGSQCVALILLNFLNEWVRPEVIRKSRRYRTFTRDGWRCQVPGCGSRSHLNGHHVIFRIRNGPDEGWNMVTTCRLHHEMIYSGCISVRGKAPEGLEWAMGINAAGDVRERYRNGLRVACNPLWNTAMSTSAAPRTVAPDDWRQACDAVA